MGMEYNEITRRHNNIVHTTHISAVIGAQEEREKRVQLYGVLVSCFHSAVTQQYNARKAGNNNNDNNNLYVLSFTLKFENRPRTAGNTLYCNPQSTMYC